MTCPNYLTDSEDLIDTDLICEHFPTPAYLVVHSVCSTFRKKKKKKKKEKKSNF